MEILYALNYAIFAIFICLFVIEVGIALLSLVDYDRHRDEIRRYILPIWGADGTFAVFYIVNTVGAFPGLIAVASLYIVPVLIGATFFLLRSVSIAYSEYTGDRKDESTYMKVYGIFTILLAFVVIAILASAMSGAGIGAQQASVDTLSVFLSPFAIGMFIAAALVALFLSSTRFGVHGMERVDYLLLPGAFVAAVGSLSIFVPSISANFAAHYIALAVSVAFMVVVLLLRFIKSRFTFHAGMLWLFVSINALGILQYPYLLGGSASFLTYITNPLSESIILIVTLAGGILLSICMGLFIYLNYMKKETYGYRRL